MKSQKSNSSANLNACNNRKRDYAQAATEISPILISSSTEHNQDMKDSIKKQRLTADKKTKLMKMLGKSQKLFDTRNSVRETAIQNAKSGDKSHDNKPGSVQKQKVSSIADMDQNLSDKQKKMKKKLQGGRFRFLNEKLYTITGADALNLYAQQPQLFDEYHQGYRVQVAQWPIDPLDVIISKLDLHIQRQTCPVIIADMGCGEARLAATLTSKYKNDKMMIHSFDLVARNQFITAANIAHVPLSKDSVDVVVFCLSLMGTDFLEFIKEASRILKPGGRLFVAEVKSRIQNLEQFEKTLQQVGFQKQLRSDSENKMFVQWELILKQKSPADPSVSDAVKLKACTYKKR